MAYVQPSHRSPWIPSVPASSSHASWAEAGPAATTATAAGALQSSPAASTARIRPDRERAATAAAPDRFIVVLVFMSCS